MQPPGVNPGRCIGSDEADAGRLSSGGRAEEAGQARPEPTVAARTQVEHVDGDEGPAQRRGGGVPALVELVVARAVVLGRFVVEGDALVHHGEAPDGTPCELRLRFARKGVAFDDKDGQCTRSYCSAHGYLDNITFSAGSREPIRYMKRLMASPDYRAALKADKP